MKEKQLERLRKLEQLRRRYQEERHEESYGSPAELSDVKEIYGKILNSAKGCLIVLSHIVIGNKLGEYQYAIHDPIFYTLDERYHFKLRELIKKKDKTTQEIEEIEELQRRSENIYRQVSNINRKEIIGIRKTKSNLEDIAQQKDLDDLEPSDDELRRLE